MTDTKHEHVPSNLGDHCMLCGDPMKPEMTDTKHPPKDTNPTDSIHSEKDVYQHTKSVDLKDIIDLLRGIGSGVFNRDPLAHADNVIEEAVEIRDKAIAALTTLQATQSQQVEEAVERWRKSIDEEGKSCANKVEEARDQEAKLWFETWYSHYIAPKQPLPGEFGKFATERIQMTGYQRDQALTPNHQD